VKTLKLLATLLALFIVAALLGCSGTTKSPYVSDGIRKSLDKAGLQDVSISQDRDLAETFHLTVTSHKLNPLPSPLRANKLCQTRLG
jgi:hypothetical protein